MLSSAFQGDLFRAASNTSVHLPKQNKNLHLHFKTEGCASSAGRISAERERENDAAILSPFKLEHCSSTFTPRAAAQPHRISRAWRQGQVSTSTLTSPSLLQRLHPEASLVLRRASLPWMRHHQHLQNFFCFLRKKGHHFTWRPQFSTGCHLSQARAKLLEKEAG